MPATSTDDVSLIVHAIQLAIAPVFLLTGLGSMLSVMATRLSRVIDRARHLEERWQQFDVAARANATRELGVLEKRARLASWAINFCTSAALLVCAVIATLFIDVFIGTNLKWLAGTLFIAAMFALIGGLISFLREVYIATHTLRIGPPSEK
ncbi:MAG TPA: DUF2721 domain-containing protein [Burkholderiales bacterium]|nr:DUF2721 domain-containing protein [Burkholderiales bacterium]